MFKVFNITNIKKYLILFIFLFKEDKRNIYPLFLWTLIAIFSGKLSFLRHKKCKLRIYGKEIIARVAHVGTVKEVIVEKGYFIKKEIVGDYIDVGGNIGISYLFFKNLNNFNPKKIMIIEPDKNNSKLFKINFPKIEILDYVISDKNKIIKFFESKTGITSSISDNGINKSAVTLDFLIKKFELNPALIKIDVEGNELNVLKGMTNLLKEFKPSIFIEIHDKNDILKINNLLKEFNYDFCEDRGNNIFYFE